MLALLLAAAALAPPPSSLADRVGSPPVPTGLVFAMVWAKDCGAAVRWKERFFDEVALPPGVTRVLLDEKQVGDIRHQLGTPFFLLLRDGKAIDARVSGPTHVDIKGEHALQEPFDAFFARNGLLPAKGNTYRSPPRPPIPSDHDHRDLQGEDLRATSLRGHTFRQAILEEVSLRKADFSGAELEGTIFAGVDATGAHLAPEQAARIVWVHSTCPDGTPSVEHGPGCAGAADPVPLRRLLAWAGAPRSGTVLALVDGADCKYCDPVRSYFLEKIELPAGMKRVHLDAEAVPGAVGYRLPLMVLYRDGEPVDLHPAFLVSLPLEAVKASNQHYVDALLARGGALPGPGPARRKLPDRDPVAEWRGRTLANRDMRQETLAGRNLENTFVDDVDLRGVNFAGAHFDGTIFTHVDAAGASLTAEQTRAILWIGSTCPDGSTSGEAGCEGHLGRREAGTGGSLPR